MHWFVLPCVTCTGGVFLVCSAAYTVYTDPDCNLDCGAEVVVVVVVVVVASGGDGGGGGGGCLPTMQLQHMCQSYKDNTHQYNKLHLLAA